MYACTSDSIIHIDLPQYYTILTNNDRDVKLKPHVAWFDNFDFKYRGIMPTFKKSTFTMYNWLGTAVRAYRGALVKNLKLEYRDNIELPAMPDQPFALIHEFTAELTDVWSEGQVYYDQSLCVKFNVTQIPLKPVVEEKQHPRWFKALDNCVDGLRYLITEDIKDIPVGTNVDLLDYFKAIRAKSISPRNNKKYKLYNTDGNIYQRMNKVYIYLNSDIDI